MSAMDILQDLQEYPPTPAPRSKRALELESLEEDSPLVLPAKRRLGRKTSVTESTGTPSRGSIDQKKAAAAEEAAALGCLAARQAAVQQAREDKARRAAAVRADAAASSASSSRAVSREPAPEILDPVAEAEFADELLRHGVPATSQKLLLPQLRRWGAARTAQVLGLWREIGDGISRPSQSPTVQIWGPPGTGKTSIVMGYLEALDIRHIRLDCTCYSSHGELHAALAEQVHRLALSACARLQFAVPPSLQQQLSGPRLRAQDKLEAALRPSLEMMALLDSRFGTGPRPGQVVVVIDSAQKLHRLGANCFGLLAALPEGLRLGDRFTFIFISRLPLRSLDCKQPQELQFPWYTEEELKPILMRVLLEEAAAVGSSADVSQMVSAGLMKFASPSLRNKLHPLLQVGKELVREWPAGGIALDMLVLHHRVEQAVDSRLGLGNLSGLFKSAEDESAEVASARFAVQNMTKAEARLLLAAYLGSRIDREDDVQLFLPEGIKKQKRRSGQVVKRQRIDDQPSFSRPPRPIPMMRLLAIYHKLARQQQMLGPTLQEHMVSLREMGYLHFSYVVDKEPKVMSKVELPLAKACAGELSIDLAEYLCEF